MQDQGEAFPALQLEYLTNDCRLLPPGTWERVSAARRFAAELIDKLGNPRQLLRWTSAGARKRLHPV
jgi:hypothetical protein